MGAWRFLQPRLNRLLREVHDGDAGHEVRYAGRSAAASPATGSARVHAAEQAALLAAALGTANNADMAAGASETLARTAPTD